MNNETHIESCRVLLRAMSEKRVSRNRQHYAECLLRLTLYYFFADHIVSWVNRERKSSHQQEAVTDVKEVMVESTLVRKSDCTMPELETT